MRREHTNEEKDGNDGDGGEYWEEDGGVIHDVAEFIIKILDSFSLRSRRSSSPLYQRSLDTLTCTPNPSLSPLSFKNRVYWMDRAAAGHPWSNVCILHPSHLRSSSWYLVCEEGVHSSLPLSWIILP